jgi:hypothetical protein
MRYPKLFRVLSAFLLINFGIMMQLKSRFLAQLPVKSKVLSNAFIIDYSNREYRLKDSQPWLIVKQLIHSAMDIE